MSSGVIRCHHVSSGVIRCHQVSSERQTPSIGDVTDQIVLHARSSEVIRGHQRSSEVIKSSVPALTRQPRRVVASVTVRAFEDRVGPLATRGGASRHRVRECAQWSGGELGVPKEVLVDLHARSSEVIRGHQRSSEVIRSLQAPGRFAARQRARALSWRRRNRRGAGSRRTCTPIMYHHVSSHAIMCPRQSAAGICLESAYRLGKRCGEHLHARRGFINGNQRTGWESVGYVARGRRSCTRPSLGR